MGRLKRLRMEAAGEGKVLMIKFTVYGEPKTKGNLSSFPFQKKDGRLGVRTIDQNPKTKQWQGLVARVAQEHMPEDGIITGPVEINLKFYLLRPKSVSKKKRPLPTVKPDIDKLERAVLDGLTGIIYADDNLVCDKKAIKRYGDPPRVEIEVKKI